MNMTQKNKVKCDLISDLKVYDLGLDPINTFLA